MSFYITRPWGWMIKIIYFKKFWLKIIKVKKGEQTSLQSHNFRIEYHFWFWGFKKIDIGIKHRIQNGLYLELAFGKPDESDIIRYEDEYGRE